MYIIPIDILNIELTEARCQFTGAKVIHASIPGSRSGWRVWGTAKVTNGSKPVSLDDPRIDECIASLRGIAESAAVRGPRAAECSAWADWIEREREWLRENGASREIIYVRWEGSAKGFVPYCWTSRGKVVYQPQTEWECRTLHVNGFRKDGPDSATYSRTDDSAARQIAHNISRGGIG